MKTLSRPEDHPIPLRPDAASRILLFDHDDRRRRLRVDALRQRGALVDAAAETLAARTLWKPGAYDLLLIDLRGADADCEAFIAFVQQECSGQKFGFYLAHPPYLTGSAAECRTALTADRVHGRNSGRPRPAPAAGNNGESTLATASRRIAAYRQGAEIRARAQEYRRPSAAREEPSPAPAESHALQLARRLLGGSEDGN